MLGRYLNSANAAIHVLTLSWRNLKIYKIYTPDTLCMKRCRKIDCKKTISILLDFCFVYLPLRITKTTNILKEQEQYCAQIVQQKKYHKNPAEKKWPSFLWWYTLGISVIVILSACCLGGVGFEYGPHNVILETLKLYLLLLCQARDLNSKRRGECLVTGTTHYLAQLGLPDKRLCNQRVGCLSVE